MNRFLRRIVGAMTFDVGTYEEVEADRHANGQALAVVVLSAAAGAAAATGLGGDTEQLPTLMFLGILTWAGWSALVFQVGHQVMPSRATRTDIGELLRTIGFASAPGMLAVVGLVPALSRPTVTVTTIWMLAAMVLAVRQALDYTSTLRAIAVCVVGLGLSLLMMFLFSMLLTPALSAPV